MKHFMRVMLCLLLVVCCVLSACERSDGTEEQTTEKKTTKKTTAAATTEAPKEQVTPPNMRVEIIEQNLPIGRLTEGVVVDIDEKTQIELNYQGWPTICSGDGNTLYAVSSLRIGHICPFGATAFYKSEDGGVTWSDVRIINDGPCDDRDAGIVYLGNGKILVSWFVHKAESYITNSDSGWTAWQDKVTPAQKAAMIKRLNGMSAEEKQAGSYVMLSEDGGETWNEPVKVPVSAPHGPSLLDDGTLVYFGDPMGKVQGFDFTSGNFYVIQSRDNGRTWKHRATIPMPLGGGYTFDEPYILQLRDGSFIGGVRAHDPYKTGNEAIRIFLTYSKDGYTWTTPELLEGTVGTPPHFFETAEGVLILAYSHRLEPCGARGRLSYDGGKTWGEEFKISVATQSGVGDLGYPSTAQLPDGTLITAYYQRYEEDKFPSLLYTRWRLVPVSESDG